MFAIVVACMPCEQGSKRHHNDNVQIRFYTARTRVGLQAAAMSAAMYDGMPCVLPLGGVPLCDPSSSTRAQNAIVIRFCVRKLEEGVGIRKGGRGEGLRS